MGNTFVAQLTAHVVVPPESGFGAELSGPFIPPPLLLPLELLLLPDDAGPDEDPEPDDELAMPAGSGGVRCESPFGGP
jgi:hypothetical protein